MRHAGEPSVEEILESIKKVIARDNRAEAAQQRGRRESVSPAAQHASRVDRGAPTFDVLELTEAETADLSPAYENDAYDAENYEDEAADTVMGAEGDRPLIPESATASMRDSLAALAMLSGPGASPQIVRSGETSLEGLARELLRPMLAEWLEKNLPAMVEKLVAAEIARIAGKRG